MVRCREPRGGARFFRRESARLFFSNFSAASCAFTRTRSHSSILSPFYFVHETHAWRARSLCRRYHTAIRFKTARNRGPAGVSGVAVRNVTGLGVDLMVDIQSYYSCQNSSGTKNYKLCRELTQGPPLAPDVAPAYSNGVISGVRGDAWRPVWLNCLPEHPCTNITFSDVQLDSVVS